MMENTRACAKDENEKKENKLTIELARRLFPFISFCVFVCDFN